jgi:hypothetical protein
MKCEICKLKEAETNCSGCDSQICDECSFICKVCKKAFCLHCEAFFDTDICEDCERIDEEKVV